MHLIWEDARSSSVGFLPVKGAFDSTKRQVERLIAACGATPPVQDVEKRIDECEVQYTELQEAIALKAGGVSGAGQ